MPVIIVPSFTVLVGLIVGATAEFIVHLPLRLLHADKYKDVNMSEVRDIFLSN